MAKKKPTASKSKATTKTKPAAKKAVSKKPAKKAATKTASKKKPAAPKKATVKKPVVPKKKPAVKHKPKKGVAVAKKPKTGQLKKPPMSKKETTNARKNFKENLTPAKKGTRKQKTVLASEIITPINGGKKKRRTRAPKKVPKQLSMFEVINGVDLEGNPFDYQLVNGKVTNPILITADKFKDSINSIMLIGGTVCVSIQHNRHMEEGNETSLLIINGII